MKRKPNNPRARAERAMRGLLRVHRACIVYASVPEVQVMLHHKTCHKITSKPVARAFVDVAQQMILESIKIRNLTGLHYFNPAIATAKFNQKAAFSP